MIGDQNLKKRLILAGGGHAHLLALHNLKQITSKGHEVILIGPSEFHYYSGMGPGMLGGKYEPENIRFNIKKMAESSGGSFIRDSVERIDPGEKFLFLRSGRKISYDLLSFNIGSMVPFKTSVLNIPDVFTVKPVENLYSARNRLIKLCGKRKISVSIIGGGPAAAEIAGNINSLCKNMNLVMPDIAIYCDGFMANFPSNFSNLAKNTLKKNGVRILEQYSATDIEEGLITFGNGKTINSDVIFIATGVLPSPVFKKSNLDTGPDGGLSVNRCLQSIIYPEIFGGGDCIHFTDQPLDKAGVYAVREASVLLSNIISFLDNKPLKPFYTASDYLMILNIGNKNGILKKYGYTFEGKTAFMLKDYIDRRFMKKFSSR